MLDLPLELRNGDDGCAKPYVSTGYSSAKRDDPPERVGRRAGPRAVVPLKMSAADIDLFGCLSPGATTQPCNGFEVPLPATVSMNLQVAVVAGPLTAPARQFARPPSTAYGCVARHASAAVPSTMMFSAPRSSPFSRSARSFASSSVATEMKTCFQRRSGARPSDSSRSATASAC